MTSLAIALNKAATAARDESLHWKGTEYVRLRELARVLEAEARVAAQKEPTEAEKKLRHYTHDGTRTECGVRSEVLSYVIRGEPGASQPEARGTTCPRCLELLTARLTVRDNETPGR